jgi:parallel beta-helix repeat protein
MFFYNSAAELRKSTIATNTATHEGGGMYVSASNNLTLTHNRIFNNSALIHGGGLYLRSSAAMLDRNVVFTNTARDYGGGLFLEKSDAVLRNTVVVDNRAGGAGTGLYIEGASPQLLHTTIAHNSGGDGTGIYVTDDGWDVYSSVSLTNTILVGHSLGVIVTADSRVVLNATLWGTQQTSYWGGEGEIERSNDVLGVAGLTHIYRIAAGSAAVDAGVDAGVRVDVDGQPRPYQAPDLGADEFWPPDALKAIYLPMVMR